MINVGFRNIKTLPPADEEGKSNDATPSPPVMELSDPDVENNPALVYFLSALKDDAKVEEVLEPYEGTKMKTVEAEMQFAKKWECP
ncbi:hypothetical protein L198_00483 [Cryptococcus wingfieldii CBS 7118]|uniref:Uncharacterized protein n=1 Tax=Cryptococcus wingfieldii CBS 7118 TaxID=1295528 RepID=A0A1E3K6H8_9TREE|nr:hypothetical protein L198_00483 [Cryptococcus wingfieldii CBS 7118]ODO08750.1 hypothetical protein L198_00483 [Cryptococcus wingfieldii CBS 7118]